jgi:hypothetical protein
MSAWNPYLEGTMNKSLIALIAAAAAVAAAPMAEAGFNVRLPGAPSLVTKASCDEDCAEYLEDMAEAREEVVEGAAEAAEEAAEYGYRPQRQQRSVRAERQTAKAAASEDDKDSPHKSSSSSDTKSSGGKSKVAVNGACKQYFPALGMALSVPCE